MAKSVSIADSPLHLPEYGDRLVSSYGSVSSPKFLLWSSTIQFGVASRSLVTVKSLRPVIVRVLTQVQSRFSRRTLATSHLAIVSTRHLYHLIIIFSYRPLCIAVVR